MGIKEKIESHPLYTALVVAGILVTGYITFNEVRIDNLKQLHQIELEEYKTKIAAIEKNLSIDGLIDIKKFFVSYNNLSTVPASASYFQDGFYASKDSKFWNYRNMSENDYNELFFNYLPDEEIRPAGEMIRLHIWLGENPKDLVMDGMKTRIASHIGLQKMPKNVVDLMTDFIDSAQQANRNIKISEGDWVGKYFAFKASSEVLSFTPGKTTELVKAQKIGSIMYSQYFTTYDSVIVDGKFHSKFFVRTEDIIFATKNNLYLIQSFIPSNNPIIDPKEAEKFNQWFSEFRVVAE